MKKMKWPQTNLGLPLALRENWTVAVGKLLELQKPELEAQIAAAASGGKKEPPAVLFPFQVLVKPLEMRFKYHFEGDRPTNRLDKPEYFLQHVEDLLNTYTGFVGDELQPILVDRFRGTDMAFNPVYIDATSALITALLPVVRAKVFAILPAIAAQPQLLSHLMHELMQFDSRIRDDWGYSGGSGGEGWNGLAWEVLVQQDWFGRWLQVEKDCKTLVLEPSHVYFTNNEQLPFNAIKISSTPQTAATLTLTRLSRLRPSQPRLLSV